MPEPNMIDATDANAVAARIEEIVAQGYTTIALYLFESSDFKVLLTRDIAEAISPHASLISVFENGTPTNAGYFSTERGNSDGHIALARAQEATQPTGSVIYAAVDYDASEGDLDAIKDYFTEFQRIVKAGGYLAGCYGSGLVLTALTDAGYISHTWLSESTGFAGHAEWAEKANIVQLTEAQVLGIDVDTNLLRAGAGEWRVG